MACSNLNDMPAAIPSALQSDESPDITIHCGGEEILVNRSIICARCPFFSTACNGPFLVIPQVL